MPENSNRRDLHESLARTLTQEVSEEFNDETGRSPSILELIEILTWTIRGVESDSIEDMHPSQLLGLEAIFATPRPKSSRLEETQAAREEVSNLNDAVFVVASDSLGDLLDTFKRDLDRSPKIKELCDILQAGLNLSSGALSDTAPNQILRLEPLFRKGKKITPKPGDIIAIPASGEEYYLGCVLAKNHFGVAYGFFKGTHTLRPISLNNHPDTYEFPLYSGEVAIAEGRWLIVGRDEALLGLFPADPEIFHRRRNDENSIIGPFGSGETVGGRLRDLTEKEARDSGLLAGTYQQVFLEEILEEYLPKLLLT